MILYCDYNCSITNTITILRENTSMVIVNLINENDNIPIVTCQPVQADEELPRGYLLTIIAVSSS